MVSSIMSDMTATGPDGRTAQAATGPAVPRVFAIASAGGHWQQLMELRPALSGCELRFGTTLPGLAEQYGATPVTIVRDFSRTDIWRLPAVAVALWREFRRFRPEVVISTGALPGWVALVVGKAFGARTIWVDSIANAERMSMSGRMARRVADLWLSQWPHVAEAEGADYTGAIL